MSYVPALQTFPNNFSLHCIKYIYIYYNCKILYVYKLYYIWHLQGLIFLKPNLEKGIFIYLFLFIILYIHYLFIFIIFILVYVLNYLDFLLGIFSHITEQKQLLFSVSSLCDCRAGTREWLILVMDFHIVCTKQDRDL